MVSSKRKGSDNEEEKVMEKEIPDKSDINSQQDEVKSNISKPSFASKPFSKPSFASKPIIKANDQSYEPSFSEKYGISNNSKPTQEIKEKPFQIRSETIEEPKPRRIEPAQIPASNIQTLEPNSGVGRRQRDSPFKYETMKTSEESKPAPIIRDQVDTIPTLETNSRRLKAKDPFAKYDTYDPLSRFQNAPASQNSAFSKPESKPKSLHKEDLVMDDLDELEF